MSKFVHSFCASLCAFSCVCLFSDEASSPPFAEVVMPEIASYPSPLLKPRQEILSLSETHSPPVKIEQTQPRAPSVQKAEVPFSPFTGKIKGRKVRLRLRADLDSRIIQELNKNALISIIGEKGDFWAVEPPAHLKAYVFRSFVLDNVIENNHVNVRLEPSLDAPIIGHLNVGDKVDAVISAVNNKWCEITPPAGCHFYVAKDLVAFAGNSELKKQMDKRLATGEELLDTTSLLGAAELRKSFDDIDFNRVAHSYNTVINDFDEFPELIEQAKETLANFQEAYLQKRIAHLELQQKEEVAASKTAIGQLPDVLKTITDKMKMWEPVEEALYLTWANYNDRKNINQFYEDQKLTAETISGMIDAYISPVKNKPGDYILRNGDIPIAYVYSAHVNLHQLIGKRTTLLVTPRPNNNFAFPAYYVLDVQ